MIHVGRTKYPYLEEVNDGILREFDRLEIRGGRVLDVGCGRGQLGEAIRQKDFFVWGVEQDPEACAMAASRLNRLTQLSLLDFSGVQNEIGDERFDVLVFSDVLEHLYDPRTVLETYLQFVRDDGFVLVSLPNAVVWTNRLNWLVGRVEYQDTGVMDRTHVRFFTFRTARRLVEACGCAVTRISSTPHVVRAALPLVKRLLGGGEKDRDNPRALIESKPYRSYMRFVYPWEQCMANLWRSMLAFRIIIVGRKAKTDSSPKKTLR